ncbi:MAG TPA: YidC/Oxa1 family insertase periplasmic-domain containing protein, partial [Gemmataceae bacterium]|nr:YidC/Oxa1 family insertase periplasmic-domain containing protein [Gemmataceae bacterium]
MTVMVGWMYVQKLIWPNKPKLPEKLESGARLVARFIGASTPGWSGLDVAPRLAWEAFLVSKPIRPVESKSLRLPNSLRWESLPGTILGGLDSAAFIPGCGSASRLAMQIALANWSEVPRIRTVARRVEPVQIGSDSFNLKVTLTPRGAGVQSVTLPKFDRANYLGEPEYDNLTKKPLPLDLVPDSRNPSNILLHYSNPGENEDHPEGDLGESVWTVVSKKNGINDECHEVVFTCDVPGQNITLTKTYTLWPKDYHIGLAIAMERKGDGTDPSYFRYQLTGTHGLPIEGEFYTTVFTNAVTGQTDGKGGLWRDLQEARAIGFQDGGKKVPRGDDKYIRYAGIVSQFF